MNNPLIQAYRKPALYVSLPSAGKYYDPKPKLSVDGELAIYAMTARDELITKTPDALFNGESTVALLKSCAPDIQNPEQMPVGDLLVVLLAIRRATYGNDLDMDVTCPECKHINMMKVECDTVLSTAKPLEATDQVKLENGFVVYVKPYNLADRTLLQIQQIKQRKMIESVVDQGIDESERNRLFGSTFVELAELTVRLISNSIRAVRPEGSEEISDNETISEWLESITKSDYDLIRSAVEDLSDSGLDTKFQANCQECQHTWQTDVELDLANFFEG
jgi:phage FluMu protein Com